MDFNGMVRHYYLRQAAHYADIRVTLAPRQRRAQQSHALLLRIRKDLEAIARAAGARMKLVEVPPGPPVVATVKVEVYGNKTTSYAMLQQAARTLEKQLAQEPLVVDIDSSLAAEQAKIIFVPDREKAALSGIATEDIARTVMLSSSGLVAGYLQITREVHPLPVVLRLPYTWRNSPNALTALHVRGRPGITKIREKAGLRNAAQPMVPLAELGCTLAARIDPVIYHKNLKPVVYVFAEAAGRTPAEIVADVAVDQGSTSGPSQPVPLAKRSYLKPGGGIPWTLPAGVEAVWSGEGEWQITLRVFRGLGLAFGLALVGIFIVLRVQTGLSTITGIIMLAIPLSVIGIMPGFWLLNQLGRRMIEGYPDPVLFTATAMIGMIALAGIVVRNSLILIEFIQGALRRGETLREALVQAGAT